jgi:hypothetical protein
MAQSIFPESDAWAATISPPKRPFNKAAKDDEDFYMYAALDLSLLGCAEDYISSAPPPVNSKAKPRLPSNLRETHTIV